MIDSTDLARHNSRASCWIALHGDVWDVTGFIDAHPGGSAIILKNAGQDATTAFDKFHSVDVIDRYMDPKHNKGKLFGGGDSPKSEAEDQAPSSKAPVKMTRTTASTISTTSPPRIRLSSLINLSDFEHAASLVLPPRAFAFFKSGADDEATANWNRKSWRSLRFRPRVLRPVSKIDTSAQFLGQSFSVPFFIAPAGGGKLANPAHGEVLMTRAAGKEGVLQWVCSNAGCSMGEMAGARTGQEQVLFWQIYALTNLEGTEREVRKAVKLGYKGFCLTVDAVEVGKRERDMRLAIKEQHAEEETKGQGNGEDEDPDAGLTGGISVSRPTVKADFDWKTAVQWLRKLTDLPIAIKGIQCWEDAALCMDYGLHPWLSNHGGRQLEGAPSAVDTLIEIRKHCPDVFTRCDVIVDGGITRGTDVVKALALGAKGVGVGRPFLFSLAFGEAGVTRAIRILKREVAVAMALLGVASLAELRPEHVDASGLAYAGALVRANL